MCQLKVRTTTYGLRSITYTGAKMWNDLSPAITDDFDLHDFKIYLNDLHLDHLDSNFNYV